MTTSTVKPEDIGDDEDVTMSGRVAKELVHRAEGSTLFADAQALHDNPGEWMAKLDDAHLNRVYTEFNDLMELAYAEQRRRERRRRQ